MWRRNGCPSCVRCIRTRRASRRSSRRPRAPARVWTRDEAIVELLRGRVAIVGPTTARGARRDARRSTWPTRTRRCSRSKSRASSCAGRFPPKARAALATRVVRPPAARAHPSLHAQPAARGDRTGQPRRLHALPVRVAARRAVEPADRHRRAARRARVARRLRAGGRRLGARRPAGSRRRLSVVDARHAVPDRRGRLGAAVLVGARRDAGGRRDADRAVPARACRRVGSCCRDRRRATPPAHEPSSADDAARVLERAPQRAAPRSSPS